MRYRDLKNERDAAVARAIEAERLSMKSEFDRVTAKCEQEKSTLRAQISEDRKASYLRGFNAGLDAMANDISSRLKRRTALFPKRGFSVATNAEKEALNTIQENGR